MIDAPLAPDTYFGMLKCYDIGDAEIPKESGRELSRCAHPC